MDERNARVIGLDQGDRFSHLCVLNAEGAVVLRDRVRTTREAYRRRFAAWPGCRVVLEVGTHSPWSSRLLGELGLEVVVANPRRVKLISQAERKTDRVDAETLARLGRVDPQLLAPIRHGSEAMQRDRASLRLREGLVRSRTRLIQQARGVCKALGAPLPACSAGSFARRMKNAAELALVPGMARFIEEIEQLCAAIRAFDRDVEHACAQRHPVTAQLRQVAGVGPITALAYVVTLEDPTRFAKSREVGPFLGLVPRAHSSGERQPELGIPHRGDVLLRRCLVQAAHYVLGPFGPDTELRRVGLAIAARGGQRAKKRAVIAVARRLAVLLHRLWVTGETYQPIGYRHRAARAA